MRKPATAALNAVLGFTLVELVVVLAIFAIFSLMAWGGLNSVMTTRAQVEEAQSRITEVQKAYLRLRNDLQQVRFRPTRDGFGDLQPALRSGENGYLEFTRGGWSNPLRLPRTGLERVAYRYQEGKLVRLSWRVLDLAQDSRPVENPLIEDVEEVRWRFLSENREWRESWPTGNVDRSSAATVIPPLAVELTLRLKDMGTLRYLFRTGDQYPVEQLRSYRPQGGTDTGTQTQGDINGNGTSSLTPTSELPPGSFD